MKNIFTYKDFLNETNINKEIFKKKFYHGTKGSNAQKIFNDGYLKPGTISTENEFAAKPRLGKVYITPNINYAIGYAIPYHDEEFGVLFEMDGSELKDIEPDEDSIGEMIYNHKPTWLYNFAQKHLDKFEEYYFESIPSDLKEFMYESDKNLFELILDGMIAAWAFSGKIIINELTNKQQLELISMGAHVAHNDVVYFNNAWRINEKDVYLLKEDYSNFFNIAKKIK